MGIDQIAVILKITINRNKNQTITITIKKGKFIINTAEETNKINPEYIAQYVQEDIQRRIVKTKYKPSNSR